MATKVTILGEQPIEQEKKKIEFVYVIDMIEAKCVTTSMHPDEYLNIELIRRNSFGFDVMFAYNEQRHTGSTYLGHFNDGIV